MASMVRRVLSAETLTSPRRLYSFLDAATRSIALDADLASLGRLVHLAQDLRAIDASHVRFLTAPVEEYPPDHNRVQLAPEAEQLWRLLREDRPLGALAHGAIEASDDVGTVDGDDDSEAASARRADGLCS